MDELKPCPCNTCLLRKAIARKFDVHIWGEDCPYECGAFADWRVDNGT